jgi:two-component system, chemotaxis family, sensor kinase CheA
MDPMEAIKATFFVECEEQLAELESGLMAMEAGATDSETVNAVFRAVHSIKGGAGAFSLDELVRFAHVFETTLDAVRAGRLQAAPATLQIMLRAADGLADLVRVARDGGTADAARIAALAAELAALINPGGASSGAATIEAGTDIDDLDFEPVRIAVEDEAPAARSWKIRFKPHAELYAKGNEAGLLLRELGRLGEMEVQLDSTNLPDLAELDPEGAYLTWNIALIADVEETAIRDVFDFVEDECELEIADAGQAGAAQAGASQADAAPAAPAMQQAGQQADPAPEIDVMALIGKAQEASRQEQPPVLVTAVPVQAQLQAAIPSAPSIAAADAPSAGETTVGATIRVDLDRVDRLIDLVGELVINEAMLYQRSIEAGLTRASAVGMALEELERLTHEIQDGVMAIRAQPVRSVFQRMPRLVRQVAAQTGKQVRLLTEGEATEVDKTVIERLADPLTHMIRNAIDHGLESPEQRIAAGKPAEGTVRLHALHRSGRIVIEVADDGAGINRARVRDKAIQNGLIAADAQLTDEETDNLIFLPGFSTADAISDISGRGVGMDVVRRSVQALGGRIVIASRPGLGSTFTLSLPLTLAVLDGMVVTASGHTLIIPLGMILETLQPRADAMHALGMDLRLIFMRGSYVPLVDLGLALGFRSGPPEVDGVAVLVEGEGGARSVLLVDAILGQRQVVIKSLEANYRAVPGIAGATVMGDGRVALILDVDVMVTQSNAAATNLSNNPLPETALPDSRPNFERTLAEVS